MAKTRAAHRAEKAEPTGVSPDAEYTVVARRYRPQQFADLVGQEHVAQALDQRPHSPAASPTPTCSPAPAASARPPPPASSPRRSTA